jgi:short-subunit dehydrogenase
VLVARRRERLDELASALQRDHGVAAEVLVADLADADDLARVARRAAADDVGLLVNNAAISGYAPFAEADPAALAQVVALNVNAPVALARAALPGMLERAGGAIVNVASLLAFSGAIPPDPLPQRVVYASCKAYLVAFSQLLQNELVDSGVRIQVLCPGLVKTEFHEVAGRDPTQLPYGAMEPEDVVRASLRGLEFGEVICAPGLQDTDLLATRDDAQTTLFRAAVAGSLTRRYAD